MLRIFQVFFASILVLATLHNKIPSLYIVHAIRDAPVPALPNFGNAASVFPPSIVFFYSIHIPISQSPYLFSLSSALRPLRSPKFEFELGANRRTHTLPHFSKKKEKKKKRKCVSRSIGRRKTYHGLPQKGRQTFFRPFPSSLPFRAKKEGPLGDDQLEEEKDIPPHFRSLSLALFFFSGKAKVVSLLSHFPPLRSPLGH